MRNLACVAALLLGLTACGDLPEGTTPGTVQDPYADLPDGGARYTGTLGALASGGVLAGLGTPEGFATTAGDTVAFEEGQVALSEAARATIAAQARWLTDNRQFTAVIEGHADEDGTREYNLALGARRAAAVQEYLIASGVDAGRLQTVSYGRERPPSDCETANCNRRVVVRVTAGAGA